MASAVAQRTAHPYLDVAVIDERAPRFNQATVGLLAAVTVLTGWWILVALLAVQLIVGLTLGRRYCLPCVFYFEVVQPRVGEGPIEDARPPRFANMVGAIFLSASTFSFAVGLSGVGIILAGIVAVLALLAAVTGLCVGCEMYRLIARLRGVRPGGVERVDLAALDATDSSVVLFTHPLCSGCREVESKLDRSGEAVALVDVSRRPEAARSYHVSVVPTAFRVAPDGRVLERLA